MPTLSKNQIDDALRAGLASMEEDQEYILTEEAWEEYQGWRKFQSLPFLGKDYRMTYSFKVKENVFLFDSRYWHIIFQDVTMATVMDAALSTGTVMSVWLAIITDRIEKKNTPSKAVSELKIYNQDNGYSGHITVIAHSEQEARTLMSKYYNYVEKHEVTEHEIKNGLVLVNYGDM